MLLVIIYAAFISLGLPDGIFGAAWPTLRLDFAQPLAMAGIVSIILTTCSAISSFSSAKMTARFSTGKLTAICCFVTGMSMIGYVLAPSFIWIILCTIPLGLGQGNVDCSINNYVANNYSSRQMNWLHCCWGIGAAAGPMMLSFAASLGATWRFSYGLLGALQLALCIVLFANLKLWTRNNDGVCIEKVVPANAKEVLSKLAPWLSILVYIFYTAGEASMGVWSASLLVDSRGFSIALASVCVSVYYIGIAAGRLLSGFFSDRLGNRKMITLGLLVALFGGVLLLIPNTIASVLAIGCIGVGFAPVYPCMMHETAKRFESKISLPLMGYQVGFAYVGMIGFSPLVGLIATYTSIEIMVPIVIGFIVMQLILANWLNKLTPAT